jgi:hypothetical protein
MMDCPECGAKPGAWHEAGCSWAQCPYCWDHLTACDHEPPRDDQLRWAGCDFWLAACLQLGLFRRRTSEGWVRGRAFTHGPIETGEVNSRRSVFCFGPFDECRLARQQVVGAK